MSLEINNSLGREDLNYLSMDAGQREEVIGYRLSPQQKRIWQLLELSAGTQRTSPRYRAQCAVKIAGEVDAALLNEAVHHVIAQHDILHTVFRALSGISLPLQVIGADALVSLSHDDLSGLKPTAQAERIESLWQELAQMPFNVEHGPLLHVASIGLSPESHLLFFSAHALCADRIALRNLINEIGEVYACGLRVEESTSERMQYADVSDIFNQLLEAPETERGRAFWRDHQLTKTREPKLPFEQQPQLVSFNSQLWNYEITTIEITSISAVAQEYGTPKLIPFLACWQILLWHLTGRSDVIIGTACDGRNYEGLDELVGIFTRYLPLRSELKADLSFVEVLKQTNQTFRDFSERQEFFSWENFGGPSAASTELFWPFSFDYSSHPLPRECGNTTFSITKEFDCLEYEKLKLRLVEKNNSLIAEFYYDGAIFSPNQIQRLAEQYGALLKSVTEGPTTAIGKLNVLSDEERTQLLKDFNDTAREYPRSTCVHELFETQAAQTPAAVALISEGEQLSYEELNQRANQLAHHLRACGVGPEVLVGICLERSIEMVVAVLGVLKAGGAYVPLDPAYPRERLQLILQDAAVSLVLTQERLLGGLPECDAHILCMDTDSASIVVNCRENLTCNTDAQNLAYVIYTSGSTGRPKGVLITHQDVVNHNFALSAQYELKASDRVLQFASLSFDVAVEEMFPTWLSGGCVVLLAERALNSYRAFLQFLADSCITVVNLPTSYWNEVIAELAGLPDRFDLSLRLVAMGGDKGLPEHFEATQQLLGTQTCVMNVYGPTETTVTNTAYHYTQEDGSNGDVGTKRTQSIPIGRPVANTQVYVLDQKLQPVSIGLTGEIYIGGESVARGYLNQAALTAERFVPNPFSHTPGARLYRTGDLARFNPDGNIEFLRRIDTQVKVRGFRIELGEIEAALRQHEWVREAVVVVREERVGDQRLVAYVVTENGPAVSQVENDKLSSQLRHYLKASLPDYMLPTAYVVLPALPLTSNGKVDRRALPAPPQLQPEPDAVSDSPLTPTEELLSGIWAEVLGLAQVSRSSDFFELGGHSLLATQVISRIWELFGVEVPLRALFERPTVAELSISIDEALLEKLEEMPDSEIERILANR